MEQLEPRTLLKAKDGSEYVVFLHYNDKDLRKTDIPTPQFRGFTYGTVDGRKNRIYKTADYKVADAVDQKYLEDINELRRLTYNFYAEFRKTREKAQRKYLLIESISEAPDDLQNIISKLNLLQRKIQAVVYYTGGDSVKSSIIKKELEDIAADLTHYQRCLNDIFEAAKKKDNDNDDPF